MNLKTAVLQEKPVTLFEMFIEALEEHTVAHQDGGPFAIIISYDLAIQLSKIANCEFPPDCKQGKICGWPVNIAPVWHKGIWVVTKAICY